MTVEKKQPAPKTKKTTKSAPKKKEVTAAVKSAPKETSDTGNLPPQPASKIIGSLANKMIDLTQIGAKKLEDYAAKSAEENDNNNARKLAAAMNRFSQKLESNQENYVTGVEKNAEELIEIGKNTFGSMKKVFNEMKTRASTAKQKAEQDVEIIDTEDNK